MPKRSVTTSRLFCILLPSVFHYYRPQTKFAKVMFLHLSVNLFTGGTCLGPGPGGGWGVCVSRHALRQPPLPLQTATAADGTHPTGMHSCLHFRVLC